MKIDVMGTEYDVLIDDLNNPELSDADGVCRQFDKEIVIRNKQYQAGCSDNAQNERYSHVVRHELIHAIACECGVNYDEDENLVDWIAHIIPTVVKLEREVLSDKVRGFV